MSSQRVRGLCEGLSPARGLGRYRWLALVTTFGALTGACSSNDGGGGGSPITRPDGGSGATAGTTSGSATAGITGATATASATGTGTTATTAGTTATGTASGGTTASGTTTAGATTATTGGTTGATGGTPGSTTTTTSTSGGDAGAGGLGKACATDADCGGSLFCIKATAKLIFGQGGPANGYCSIIVDTQAASDSCTALGGTPFDLKLAAADPAEPYCLQGCTHGAMPDGTSPPRASKCNGRFDVACTPTTDNNGAAFADVCVPVCSQDSDCPTGRKCDPNLAVCVDTPYRTGSASGAHCTSNADAGTDSCAGACLPVGLASYCSRRCVFLDGHGCDAQPSGMSVAGGYHGICALGSSDADVGDVGYCVQECDTTADCIDKTDPGLNCNMDVATAIGHGYCSWDGTDAGTTRPPDAGKKD